MVAMESSNFPQTIFYSVFWDFSPVKIKMGARIYKVNAVQPPPCGNGRSEIQKIVRVQGHRAERFQLASILLLTTSTLGSENSRSSFSPRWGLMLCYKLIVMSWFPLPTTSAPPPVPHPHTPASISSRPWALSITVWSFYLWILPPSSSKDSIKQCFLTAFFDTELSSSVDH